MKDSRWSANIYPLRGGLGAKEQGSTGSDGTGMIAGGSVSGSASGSGSASFVGLNNGESGILRKTGALGHHHHHHHHYGQDSFADLLVFGYSCKVFRDDEKARFIDQGRHLIPWMGDNQLKIDRYDARGALHDLSQYEPPVGGYGNRFDCLPPAEQRAEQLCEDERYYSLYANEVEEEIYQEEVAKRQLASGTEIPFNYDAPPVAVEGESSNSASVGPESSAVGSPAGDENSIDPPFVAPVNFEIPPDLEVPDTMKKHAIIEKTAKFIASQDSQMEILLRAKQAANPQFSFLNPDGQLHRYYRHMLMAIKTNRYPENEPETDTNGAEAAEPVETASPPQDTVPEKPKFIVPAIKYKPSVDCAYTQLISKITGAPIPTKSDVDDSNQESATAPTNPTQLTSLNTEFEYYTEEKSADIKKVSTGLAGLAQYDSDSDDSVSDTEATNEKDTKPEPNPEQREITFSGMLPPEIFQHVIEKTATYVAKNGYSFEDALRQKNDARFLFLRKDHEFYPYYAFRVRYLINPYEDIPKSPEKITITRTIENGTVVETPSIGIKTVNTAPVPVPPPQSQIQANKPGGAVCFSIKSKDDAAMALKTNVVQELGGDEEEPDADKEKEKERGKHTPPEMEPEHQQQPPKDESPPVEDEPKVEKEKTPPLPCTDQTDHAKKSSPVTPEEQKPQSVAADEGLKDLKRLEDRIKDKLAVAARERLASMSKEKQLQQERKKKASMFLSMISKGEEETLEEPKQTPSPQAVEPSSTPPLLKNGLEMLKNQFSDEEEDAEETSSSQLSVHSIPSQSDSPASNTVPSSAEDDVVFVEEESSRPSRSRTRTRSASVEKQKKKKHKHKSKSKKSKKKKSGSRSPSAGKSRSKLKSSKRKRSRSRSESSTRSKSAYEKACKKKRSRSQSRSRSRSVGEQESKKKRKSKKKSHKRSHKSSKSTPSMKHHHKEHKEKVDRHTVYYR